MMVSSNGLSDTAPSGLKGGPFSNDWNSNQSRQRRKYFEDKYKRQDVKKQIDELEKKNKALIAEKAKADRLIKFLKQERKEDRSELRKVVVKSKLGYNVELPTNWEKYLSERDKSKLEMILRTREARQLIDDQKSKEEEIIVKTEEHKESENKHLTKIVIMIESPSTIKKGK
jgi:hypothetical protein